MLRIERALLGPAVGDREYGLLAVSPGLAFDDPRLSLLEAFVLAARRAIGASEEAYAAFFPLDLREQGDWTLALARVSSFAGSGFVVSIDALILPQAFLDEIGWAVHRLVWRWPQQAAPANRRVDPYTVEVAALQRSTIMPQDIAPDPGEPMYFVEPFRRLSNAPAPRLHVELADAVHPIRALISLWEALNAPQRRQRSFCTNANFSWRPSNAADAAFDLTFAGQGAPAPADGAGRAAKTVVFGAGGIAPSQKQPWHDDYKVIRDACEAAHRAGALAEPRSDLFDRFSFSMDAAAGLSTALRMYRSVQGSVLPALWQVGQVLNRLSPAAQAVVENEIPAIFEEELGAAPAENRAPLTDYFIKEIAPSLSRFNAASLAEIAIKNKLLFALSETGGRRVLDAVFAPVGEEALFANAAAEQAVKALLDNSRSLDLGGALGVFAERTAEGLRAAKGRDRAHAFALDLVAKLAANEQRPRALRGLRPIFQAYAELGRLDFLSYFLRSFAPSPARKAAAPEAVKEITAALALVVLDYYEREFGRLRQAPSAGHETGRRYLATLEVLLLLAAPQGQAPAQRPAPDAGATFYGGRR